MRLLCQLLLLAILLSTAAFLAAGAAIEPMDFETANARGLLRLYEASFFAGLALSAAAVPTAAVGIVFAVRRGVGLWLKGKREAAGLSQGELAERIGRHRTYVSKIEAGARLEVVEFVRLASALGADPKEGIRAVG